MMFPIIANVLRISSLSITTAYDQCLSQKDKKENHKLHFSKSGKITLNQHCNYEWYQKYGLE